ncbi:MAG: hypothetical protein LBJ57_02450 [Prevotellaceae bacterium]|jgi:hypothetical protein|nr:hypothetical protein [Prevotellaceae bacterium]
MTTLQKLLSFIESLGVGYKVFYDEAAAMNVKADLLHGGDGFIYIEEWREGTYVKEKYFSAKTTRIRMRFCKLCALDGEATEREALREQIEAEAVLPFCKAYNASGLFSPVSAWSWVSSISRFDCNEVSLILSFNLKESICL